MISKKTIALVRDRADLESVIGDVVKLRRAGRNSKGLCPFHNEKTPSFTVFADGHFHCFGCKESGDVFEFVEAYHGVGFSEAVEMLADKYCIPIEYEKGEGGISRDERVVLYAALGIAKEFYCETFREREDVKKYIQERGFEQRTIDKFEIGYADEKLEMFRDTLLVKGVAKSALIKAGLLRSSSYAESLFFSDRIMFPVYNDAGKLVAFGGRLFGVSRGEAKYLNSPETDVFVKGRVLYGLNFIDRPVERIYVVEGYTDVMAMWQMGKKAVAPLGTAFSEEHAVRLSRKCNEIVLMFDADEAGNSAEQKAIDFVLKFNVSVKVCRLPVGSDPADVMCGIVGYDEFEKLLEDRTIGPVESLFSRLDVGSKEKAIIEGYAIVERFVGTMFEGLAIEEMARVLGMSSYEVRQSFNVKKSEKKEQKEIVAKGFGVDVFVIAALLESEEIREEYIERPGENYLRYDDGKNAWKQLREMKRKSELIRWFRISELNVSEEFRLAVLRMSETILRESLFDEFRLRMNLLRLEVRRKFLVEQMRMGVEIDMSKELDEVLSSIDSVRKQLASLRGVSDEDAYRS